MSEHWVPDGAKPLGGGEYLFGCSSCGRDLKFAWNAHRERGWCLVCGTRINSIEWLQKCYAGGYATFFPSFRNPLQGYSPRKASFEPESAAYLKSRGVTGEMADLCGATYGEGRVWFPVWSPSGLPPFTVGRSCDPANPLRWLSYPAEKGKFLFGAKPAGKTVVLVEGIFDILSPQLWGKALCTLGSSPSVDMLVWIAQNFEGGVGVWYDPGAGGDKGRKLIKGILGGWFPQLPVFDIHGPEPGSTPPADAARYVQAFEHRCLHAGIP